MLYRKYVGNILSADDAYRLNTQSRTFELRFAAQCDNASKLAGHVRPSRRRARPLSRPRFAPDAVEAARTFGERGFGAMINVDFKGGRAAADAFVEAVSDTISYVPTLGDPTTIMLHVATVWGEERGYPGMVRISVGFEPTSGLRQAFFARDEVAVE